MINLKEFWNKKTLKNVVDLSQRRFDVRNPVREKVSATFGTENIFLSFSFFCSALKSAKSAFC
jgi:hypothetical protein